MASFKTKQQQNLEDLEITRDEINQIGEALKKEEFRKLLHDYVDEITDPENQKIFEKEVIELERERGNEVTFIHPSPGYVIKTSLDGEKKAFINVCQNDKIEKPTAVPEAGGLRWSIPYSQTQPREDMDKKKNVCFVFDVVFHPDSLQMAHDNNKFKDMVSSTAMDAIEHNFKVTLDRKNIRYPKITYKGFKHPSVIRRKSSSSQKNPPGSLSEDSDQGIFEIPNYPYPPLSEESNVRKVLKPSSRPVDDYTTPKYVLKQRRNVDMQECTNSMTSKVNAAIPDEIVVEVELPLIKSASSVTLDVTEKSLKLSSENPAKYKLDITLPYGVDEDKGNAKFDSRIKKLTVTLVVKHYKRAPVLFELGREDSGVDSDMGSGFRSTESSSSEDEPIKCVEELLNVNTDESPDKEADNGYRTNKSVSFLDEDKHYTLPQFTCNMLDNILAFTFHVRNIEPESVDSKYLEGDSGIHIKFSSLGSGFFPIHYSFCVKFPNNISVDNENFNVEVWDNNVIVQISLIGCDNEEDIEEYFVGVDEKSLEKNALPNPLKLSKVMQNETDNSNLSPTSKFKVVKFAEDNVVLEISNSSTSLNDSDDEHIKETCNERVVEKDVADTKTDPEESGKEETVKCDKPKNNSVETKNVTEKYKKIVTKSSKNDYRLKTSPRSLTRTLSESQPEKSDQKVPCRGILKVCRSLSESSVDDYHWSSSSVENSDPSNNIQKIKKTVRFSDSISRKTFRSNSSILGQKKKNQRKSRNKKRAQERRASESENSEGEPDELKNHQDIESRSDEETSETQSDVSESDDGTKEEKPDVMSLSKRNPHKRGGKKSARKSANTAKMAFTNNLMFDLDM